jgi:predicted molibdopterin-dependent oxidoreductase YjgC
MLDVILGNHMLYCTVCDNNNENCRVHNTALDLNFQHQEHPFKPKPTSCEDTQLRGFKPNELLWIGNNPTPTTSTF